MTLELPAPQSIWRYRIGLGQARVIYSSESDIIAHNCEQHHGQMVSWRGSAEFFHQCFAPGNPDTYPRTASV